MQEVDSKIFRNDLDPALWANGYQGAYEKKGGTVSEGLATFWRRDKFECIETKRLVLGEAIQKQNGPFEDLRLKLLTNKALYETFSKRTTTLLIVVLRSRTNPKKILVIGNTHLYFHPDADSIRLLQIGMIMDELSRWVDKYSKEEEDCSLLLCGDFNSTPPFGVLEFMRQGEISEAHPDWKSMEGQYVKQVKLSHKFSMDSACGTPKYTNFTQEFADCLDYIFYDKEAFEVTEIVPFPAEEELRLHTAIPNVVFPSDHIACVATLRCKI